VNTRIKPLRLLVNPVNDYTTRLARDAKEVKAAQVLRFQVFNLELNEGLQESYLSGLDEDPFDVCCDHLIVEHLPSQKVVGTTGYRPV